MTSTKKLDLHDAALFMLINKGNIASFPKNRERFMSSGTHGANTSRRTDNDEIEDWEKIYRERI